MILSRDGFSLMAALLAALLLFAGCEDEETASVGESPPEPILDPADSGMVIVPAGECILGNFPAGWGNYDAPENPVWIDSFSLDRHEATNQQYADYLDSALADSVIFYRDEKIYDAPENGHLLLEVTSEYCHIYFAGDTLEFVFDVEEGFEQMPVVMVTWYGASSYAEYVGKRLPTEQEWERAARGLAETYGSLDGIGVGYLYPWGNEIPDEDLANFGDPNGSPMEVGSNGAGMSWFGAFGMAGNVTEWASTSAGSARIHRGGSFASDRELLQTAWRSLADPHTSFRTIGFRCARD